MPAVLLCGAYGALHLQQEPRRDGDGKGESWLQAIASLLHAAHNRKAAQNCYS